MRFQLNIFNRNILDEKFQIAFKEYFKELGIEVKDWIGLFKEINEDKNTQATKKSKSIRSIKEKELVV